LSYKLEVGDLVRLQPDMGYEIDWISGRVINHFHDSYYFDLSEICMLIGKDYNYFYLLNAQGNIIMTPHKDYFILC
jgi:hypothetical protein